MGRTEEENRFERAGVAVCWSTPRQLWLLSNVTDKSSRVAERAMFVEVFTQGLLDEEWVWRDSYYPADSRRRSFWAHQFAEDGTPRSVELAELEQEWPMPQLPQFEAVSARAPVPAGTGLRGLWQRLLAALER